MNQLVQYSAYKQHGLSASYTTDQAIQGVPAVNMIYINMGTGISSIGASETYRGTFTKILEDGTEVNGLNMTSNVAVETINATFKQYIAMGLPIAMPPIFQSSAGGTCFTDASTGCYGGIANIDMVTGKVDFSNADASCFDGEYLTIYYLGMGLMLEYFN